MADDTLASLNEEINRWRFLVCEVKGALPLGHWGREGCPEKEEESDFQEDGQRSHQRFS